MLFGCSSPVISVENGTGSGFELPVLDGCPIYSSLHAHGVRMHAKIETDAGPVDELPRVHAAAKDESLGAVAGRVVDYRDGGSPRPRRTQHEVQDAAAFAGTTMDVAAAECGGESQEAIAVVESMGWKLN